MRQRRLEMGAKRFRNRSEVGRHRRLDEFSRVEVDGADQSGTPWRARMKHPGGLEVVSDQSVNHRGKRCLDVRCRSMQPRAAVIERRKQTG